ncbi:MAG: hypothetical protein NXY57DRAFT_967212 [Lentinula lateritia]|nr:MAG: hypothetical protein NXY57DRAFT_967212 [Lentinula lateritia]
MTGSIWCGSAGLSFAGTSLEGGALLPPSESMLNLFANPSTQSLVVPPHPPKLLNIPSVDARAPPVAQWPQSFATAALP